MDFVWGGPVPSAMSTFQQGSKRTTKIKRFNFEFQSSIPAAFQPLLSLGLEQQLEPVYFTCLPVNCAGMHLLHRMCFGRSVKMTERSKAAKSYLQGNRSSVATAVRAG